MDNKKCERCGSKTPSQGASAYGLFDYCAKCSRDLCDACMAKGCCGSVPAKSGQEDDAAFQDLGDR
jgi:hypothetical protein